MALVPADLASGGPITLVFCAISVVAVLAAMGLYHYRLGPSFLDDLPKLVLGVCAGVGIASGFLDLMFSDDAFDPGQLGRLALRTLVLVLAARLLGYTAIRAMRRRAPGLRTLLVGGGLAADHLVRVLGEDRAYGLTLVGCVHGRSYTGSPPPLPVLGETEQLSSIVRKYGIRCLVIAFGSDDESELVGILRACSGLPCRILCVPRLYEMHPRSMSAGDIRGVPLVWIKRTAHRRRGWRAKRVLDVTVAAVALILMAPVFALCALLVRLDGGPGVLFRQERIGKNGRLFTMLKFRSMRPATSTEADTKWTIATDPRIRPVGRFLRASGLDEMPQLINILRGEMSLVGPRPERPYFVEQFQERYDGYGHRHRMPVGVTGWAQVNGLRGDTRIEDRVLLDNYYIENWSLWLDVKIVLRTFVLLVRAVVS